MLCTLQHVIKFNTNKQVPSPACSKDGRRSVQLGVDAALPSPLATVHPKYASRRGYSPPAPASCCLIPGLEQQQPCRGVGGCSATLRGAKSPRLLQTLPLLILQSPHGSNPLWAQLLGPLCSSQVSCALVDIRTISFLLSHFLVHGWLSSKPRETCQRCKVYEKLTPKG